MREFLRDTELANPGMKVTPEMISTCFTKAITSFDDAIAHDVLDLFGGSVDELDNYTDAQIRATINDQHEGGANWRKARLCMYGTTALVALVDPEHENLWVANLGDCQACTLSCLSKAVGKTTVVLKMTLIYEPISLSSHNPKQRCNRMDRRNSNYISQRRQRRRNPKDTRYPPWRAGVRGQPARSRRTCPD